jgi:cell shape-determining protein MreD
MSIVCLTSSADMQRAWLIISPQPQQALLSTLGMFFDRILSFSAEGLIGMVVYMYIYMYIHPLSERIIMNVVYPDHLCGS